MLSEIETDCDSLHGRKLLSVWRSPTTTLWHINAGKRGAVHPIKTNPGSQQYGMATAAQHDAGETSRPRSQQLAHHIGAIA